MTTNLGEAVLLRKDESDEKGQERRELEDIFDLVGL